MPRKFLVFSFFSGFSGGVGAATARNLGFGVGSEINKVGETDISSFLGDDSDYYSDYDLEEDYFFPNISRRNRGDSSGTAGVKLTAEKVILKEV